MQYLLTQEEMDAQRKAADTLRRLPTVEKLQEVCALIADTMVLTTGWAKGRVWGCILTTAREHYCDDCPVKDICPNQDKHWSK